MSGIHGNLSTGSILRDFYTSGVCNTYKCYEIYTQDVCRKQNALDLATRSTPNQRDSCLCRMLFQTICKKGKSAFYSNCLLLGFKFKCTSPLATIGYIYENAQLSCLIHVSSSGYSVASGHCKDLVSNPCQTYIIFQFLFNTI